MAYTSLITVPPYFKKNYKQPTLIAIYYTNLLATDPNFYLTLALYSANTTYKDKAITDILWKPLLACRQKVYFRVKLFPGTVILQDFIKCIGCYKP